MKYAKSLIAAAILGVSLFSAANAEEAKTMDSLKKEHDETLSTLISKSKTGSNLEVRGLLKKLCQISCETIKAAEYGACGLGESTGVKECRDGAERHRVSCRNSC
jgi:hypothetical protein